MNATPPNSGRCLAVLLWLGTWALAAQGRAADTAGAGTQEVLEHHGDAARSGLYVVPGLTWEAAGQLQRDPNFQGDVSGPVYAQPLYWRAPDSERALLLVATEQNLVYALDARSGAPAWKISLRSPVPRSSLPCGNINPLDITGTPAIDKFLRQ